MFPEFPSLYVHSSLRILGFHILGSTVGWIHRCRTHEYEGQLRGVNAHGFWYPCGVLEPILHGYRGMTVLSWSGLAWDFWRQKCRRLMESRHKGIRYWGSSCLIQQVFKVTMLACSGMQDPSSFSNYRLCSFSSYSICPFKSPSPGPGTCVAHDKGRQLL